MKRMFRIGLAFLLISTATGAFAQPPRTSAPTPAEKPEAQFANFYQTIATRFNRELAGRYPFGALESPDASLAVTRAFFIDYAAQVDEIRALRKSSATRSCRFRAAKAFLSELDKTAAFFANDLAPDASQPITVDTHFRALPAKSPGSEQIVSWRLSSGAGQASYPNGRKTLDWSYDAPVVLELNWADQSLFRPQADARQPDLDVEGQTASFMSAGPWALFRLIDRHQPTAPAAHDAKTPMSLLQFAIPVTRDAQAISTATVFVGLALSQANPSSQKPTVIVWPNKRPHRAPMPEPLSRQHGL